MTVRKAVFPAAGLGTRFLPATKAQPKEMLPLVDKPIIQYGVEEAVASGVEESSSSPAAARTRSKITSTCRRARDFPRVPRQDDLLEEIRKISSLINVAYVRQGEPLGLGHAVLVTRQLVGNEPFAVILADDMIDAELPALAQMIDVFDQVDGPVIAVERVPERDLRVTASSPRIRSARASTRSSTSSRSHPPARRHQTSRSSAATSSRRTSSRCSRRPRASEAPAILS